MKNLKTYLWILIVGTTCLSCSEDDENKDLPPSQMIIGSWDLRNRIIDGEEIGVEVCELQTNLQFLENGDFEVELFIGDDPGNCQSASSSGEYSFKDENTIEINLAGVSETTVVDVAFPEGNEVLEIIDNSDGVYKEIYVRQ